MKPAPPAIRKVERHPQAAAMKGMLRGAMTVATLAPELKIAVEKARSRLGNHSAVALMAEGKLPASPKPRATRAASKPLTRPPSECAAAATDHSVIDTA